MHDRVWAFCVVEVRPIHIDLWRMPKSNDETRANVPVVQSGLLMNTECSHCGHGFETSENLATCPKCEQVFEPSAQKRTQPPQGDPNSRQAKFWGGIALIAVGVFLTPFYVGIPIIICGAFVIKSAK